MYGQTINELESYIDKFFENYPKDRVVSLVKNIIKNVSKVALIKKFQK